MRLSEKVLYYIMEVHLHIEWSIILILYFISFHFFCTFFKCLYLNGHLFFLLQNTKFYSGTKMAIGSFIAKYKIFKTVPKRPFVL